MKPCALLPLTFVAFAAASALAAPVAVVPARGADGPASTGKVPPHRAAASPVPGQVPPHVGSLSLVPQVGGQAQPAAASVGDLLAAADEAVEAQLKLIRQFDALVETANALREKSDDDDPLVSTFGEMIAAAGTRRKEAVKLLKNLSLLSEMFEYASSDAADEEYLETAEPVFDMWRQVLGDMGYLPRPNREAHRRPGLDVDRAPRPADVPTEP